MCAQISLLSVCPSPPSPQVTQAPQPDSAHVGRGLSDTIDEWSPEAEALLGYTADEVLGRPVQMLLPEHRQHEYAWISRQLEQGEAVYDLHTQRRHKAGHLLPVSLTVVARRDRHGKLVGAEKQLRECAGEAELVRQMTQEASNFAHLFARTPMPLCITRLTDGTVLAVNPSFREFTGQPEAALVGHRTVEIGLWRDDAERTALLSRLHRQGRVQNTPLTVTLADGSLRDLLVNIEPMDIGGQPCLYVLLNDITTLRDAERRLQRRDREFAELVDSASDAIISIDHQQRICLFNRAAEAMFQVPAEEAIGQPLDRFLPGEWRSRHAALVRQFVDGGATARRMGSGRVVHGCRADGTVFPIEASISRVGQGESLRLTVVARDVSQARAAEQDHLARIAAETANEAKTAFLSRMSHELRTPLNAVLGFTQLLLSGREDPLSGGQRRQVALVQQAGWHLLALINDVLDLSRIEGGQLRVEATEVDPGRCLQEALAMAAPQAQARHITLKSPPPDTTLPIVHADPLRLRQVLLNLLSNAIKYNHPGGCVEVEAWADAPGDRLCLRVTDTGMGMSPEQLAHLYEPFNRLGREFSHEEGTGIGLVLSRELMRLMGGQLRLRSHMGEGTQVDLCLPTVTEAPRPAPPAPPPAPDAAAGSPPDADWGGRVLYIEDNPVNQLLMQQLLARCPTVELRCVETGEEGQQAVAQWQPDLVLLDMQLPDMSGLEWLQREAGPVGDGRLRVIAVSASAMTGDVAAARAAGAMDYWTKPLRLDQVVHDLARWLGPRPAADAQPPADPA
ncbi:PAS domain S-box protein [Ideonella benzenivorans]|uniref:PAS domain S-box protein n=1 Tax=Ideonella benzenivorans TaxID=2831643 RepID=UPI001CEDA8DE|nr:PAS domain S-box protein [Ideonella benzenivorans]